MLLSVLAIGLTLSAIASATVVRDGKTATNANPGVEAGGHRVLPSGPTHLACTQFGMTIATGRGLTQLATPSWNLFGALSFQRPGDRGRTMIMPLGDGSVTCIISPAR
jgi:hypothetical protein